MPFPRKFRNKSSVENDDYADFSYFDGYIVPITPKRMRAVIVRIVVFLLFFLPAGLYAQVPCTSQMCPEVLRLVGNQGRDRIFNDFGNLYNQNNVKNFGIALLGAGVVANTKMDGNFQNWYQDRVRSDSTDDFSKIAKFAGEGQFFIPIMATSAITYRLCQARWGLADNTLGDFTDRTFRGYLVGAPALLTFQSLLGAGRPTMGPSYWRPFRHANAVSGHAYIGAVPFITAAQMTDKPVVKGLFYSLSVLCAWSRVNDDAHYLSQAVLGWYLAYLSVRAVTQTESRYTLPRGLTFFPVCDVGTVGAGVYYRY